MSTIVLQLILRLSLERREESWKMRKIRIVLYAFLVCLLISTKAYAADDNVIIYDDAELLSSDEYIQLESYLKTLDSGINYLVCMTEEFIYLATEKSNIR